MRIAILLILTMCCACPVGACEPRADAADNASERVPTVVQRGRTCERGQVSNVLPSVWISASAWGYLVKFVNAVKKGRK